jgi:hypothetical protein
VRTGEQKAHEDVTAKALRVVEVLSPQHCCAESGGEVRKDERGMYLKRNEGEHYPLVRTKNRLGQELFDRRLRTSSAPMSLKNLGGSASMPPNSSRHRVASAWNVNIIITEQDQKYFTYFQK